MINIANETCYFSVSDNGMGFESKNVQGGLGLENMKVTIYELGGKIEINSNQKGTKINSSFKIG